MSLREYVIVHYHEIGLKGGNRSFFERALIRNIERSLSDAAEVSVKRLPGRLLVSVPGGVDRAVVAKRLRDVYGIANFAFAAGDRLDVEQICEVAWDLVRERSYSTFAVRSRRAHTQFPLSSRQINEEVGACLLERSGKRVHLDAPDLTVHVEIVGDLVLVYLDRVPGPGGLPVGVSGRLLVLLSAGIDSPVAAARMMRRGSRCAFVHFHSQPFTDASSVRQAEELTMSLTRFQFESRLWLVPLAPAQQAIAEACRQDLRTLLYRRMMVRIACEVAKVERAGALVTGDSLGQVASQTLENLAVVEDASALPLLRPHIGRDKMEIVAEAQGLGTFDTSSVPCQEACTLFEPRRPATRASVAEVTAAETPLDLGRLTAEAVAAAEIRTCQFPG